MKAWSPRNRFLGALCFSAFGLAVSVVACDDHGHHGGGGWASEDPCNQLTTCGTCTPVNGCGWCATSSGQGLCASDPDECDNASAFSWTWNPSGCVTPVDAGAITVGTADAGASSTDAGPSPTPTPADAGPTAALDAGAPDASDASPSSTADAADGS